MWAAVGSAGFAAIGLYDGMRELGHYLYANRLERSAVPVVEGKTSYAVVEVQLENGKKVHGYIFAPITKKGDELHLNSRLPTSQLVVTSNIKELTLQTHRTKDKYATRAAADSLAAASLACAARATMLWNQYVYYNEQFKWGAGLRNLAAPLPREGQGVACVAGSILLGYAAVKQFEKYWKLPV